MCFVKDLFWTEDEAAIQFHPPRSEYVNNHSGCLHLWKPVGIQFPLPSPDLVGVKGMSAEEVAKLNLSDILRIQAVTLAAQEAL